MNKIQKKFLPDVIERNRLPEWFIIMADTRSRGSVEYIIRDPDDKTVFYADYFIDGEFLEMKVFEVKSNPKVKGIR